MQISYQKSSYFACAKSSPIAACAYASGEYRYGFNGMEKDNENNSGAYDFGARIYEGRLGRWLALDPMWKYYPNFSSYSSFANNPNYFTDYKGKVLKDKKGNIIYTIPTGQPTIPPRFNGNHMVTYMPVDIYSNNGEKIRVYYAIIINRKTMEEVKDESNILFYNCHGYSLLNSTFFVGDNIGSTDLIKDKMGIPRTGKIKDRLKTDFSQIKDGDILVYVNDKGEPIHTAVWDSKKGKYITKNGSGVLTEMTKDELDIIYLKNIDGTTNSTGFFTQVEDEIIDIEKNDENVISNPGTTEVSEDELEDKIKSKE